MKKKVGFYGGSFDFVHNGHINIAYSLMEQHHLDEVWFSPTPQNPLKENRVVTNIEHRIKMLECAFYGESRFKVSTIEAYSNGPCRTVNTLKTLCSLKENQETLFFLIMGMDAAHEFSQWKEPEIIIQMTKLLVASRNCDENLYFKGPKEIVKALNEGVTKTSIMTISSGDLRWRIKNKLPCFHLASRSVLDYIAVNSLYC